MRKKLEKMEQAVASASMSQAGLIWYRFKKNKLAVFGLIVLSVLALVCFASPLYIDYQTVIQQNTSQQFISPGADGHIFGTDMYGRDLFARIMYGGMVSLSCGFAVLLIALILALFFGSVSGYFGGRVDFFVMRFIDIMMRPLSAAGDGPDYGDGTKHLESVTCNRRGNVSRINAPGAGLHHDGARQRIRGCCKMLRVSGMEDSDQTHYSQWDRPGGGFRYIDVGRYHSRNRRLWIFGDWRGTANAGMGDDSFRSQGLYPLLPLSRHYTRCGHWNQRFVHQFCGRWNPGCA